MVILGHFFPFYPLKTPKIKILKMKKFAGDIIIYHMMHGSSNMECNRQNFLSLSLWTIFCPFPPSPLNFEKRPTAKKCCFIWKLWWQNINYGSKNMLSCIRLTTAKFDWLISPNMLCRNGNETESTYFLHQ